MPLEVHGSPPVQDRTDANSGSRAQTLQTASNTAEACPDGRDRVHVAPAAPLRLDTRFTREDDQEDGRGRAPASTGSRAMTLTLAASCSIDPQLGVGSGKPRPTIRQRGLGEDERRQQQRRLRRQEAGGRRQQVPERAARACPAPSDTRRDGVVARPLGRDDRAHAARDERPADEREDRRPSARRRPTPGAPAAAPPAAPARRRSSAGRGRTRRTASAPRRPRRRGSRRAPPTTSPSRSAPSERDGRHAERRARAVQQAGEDVAAEAVGAERQPGPVASRPSAAHEPPPEKNDQRQRGATGPPRSAARAGSPARSG